MRIGHIEKQPTLEGYGQGSEKQLAKMIAIQEQLIVQQTYCNRLTAPTAPLPTIKHCAHVSIPSLVFLITGLRTYCLLRCSSFSRCCAQTSGVVASGVELNSVYSDKSHFTLEADGYHTPCAASANKFYFTQVVHNHYFLCHGMVCYILRRVVHNSPVYNFNS